MKNFNHEEIALMSYYDTSTRANLLTALKEALPHCEDELTKEATEICIAGLSGMDDDEFAALKVELAHPQLL